MPSVIETFQDTLAATFEAVVPADDGSGLAYRFVDTLTEERGNGQHRELVWSVPTTPEPMSRLRRLLEWQIRATLFLHRRDRTLEQFRRAVGGEINDLHRAWFRRLPLGWGSARVRSPILDPPTAEESTSTAKPRAGGVLEASTVVRVTFPFRVLCQEEN